MCGFVGQFNLFDRPISELELRRINAASKLIGHRGPDRTCSHVNGSFAISFNRLAITGLGDEGNQPFTDEKGDVTLAANAEIFNWVSLWSELYVERPPQDGSDCAVLVPLYQRYGLDFLSKINGMYAVALHASSVRQLVLARDMFGIKPLYYCIERGRSVLFASELKAFAALRSHGIAFDWQSALSDPWLRGDMGRESFAKKTFFSDIFLVPSKNPIVIDTHGNVVHAEIERTSLSCSPTQRHPEEIASILGDLLEESVHDHLMGNCDAGLLLSGGIDSIALAALASKKKSLRCFTIDIPSTRESGDLLRARDAAKTLGLPLDEITIDQNEVLSRSFWPDQLWQIESPYYGPEQIYKSFAYKRIRDEYPALKVVLSGGGSDELFGGYTPSFAPPDDQTWEGAMFTISGLMERVRQEHPRRAALEAWTTDVSGRLFTDKFKGVILEEFRDDWAAYQLIKLRDLEVYNLHTEDRLASAVSRENRVPFLDRRISETVAQVPAEERAQAFWNKNILRRALAGRVEERFINAPKVPFFYGGSQADTFGLVNGLLCSNNFESLKLACSATYCGQLIFDESQMLQSLEKIRENGSLDEILRIFKLVNMGLLSVLSNMHSRSFSLRF